jgi:hypothetical protein
VSRQDPVFQKLLADGIAARDVIGLNAAKFLEKIANNIDATPRASWHVAGVGYWVVRSRAANGYIIQGIGLTQAGAWEEWRSLHEQAIRQEARA